MPAKSKDSCSTDGLPELLAVLQAHNVAHADFLQGQLCSVTFFPSVAADTGEPTVAGEPKPKLPPGMLQAFDIMKGKLPPRPTGNE